MQGDLKDCACVCVNEIQFCPNFVFSTGFIFRLFHGDHRGIIFCIFCEEKSAIFRVTKNVKRRNKLHFLCNSLNLNQKYR